MLIVMMLVMAVQAAFQLNYTVLKAQNTSGIYAIRARIQADMAPTLLTFHYALGERFIQLQHPHLFHSAYQVGQVLHLQPTSHHAQIGRHVGISQDADDPRIGSSQASSIALYPTCTWTWYAHSNHALVRREQPAHLI